MSYPKNRYTGPKPWMDYNGLYNEYVIKNRSTQEIADEYGCQRNTIQCGLMKHDIQKDHTKIYHQYEYLYYHYVILHKTKKDIAQENNVSESTIAKLLRQYHIQMGDYKVCCQEPYSEAEIKDIIYRYTIKKESSTQIAKLYNVTHRSILLCLKRHGVERRSLSESQFNYQGKNFISALNDKDLLNEWHGEQHISCKEIGKRLGCDGSTVKKHMHLLGLKTRNASESKKGLITGSKHPNWKNGVTPLHLLVREYFHTNLAPIAAQRDNYTCCECGKKHTMIHVHHIYPFAQIMQDIYNEHSDLKPYDLNDREKLYNIIIHNDKFLDIDNLQTLCVDCHRKKHTKTISSQADAEKTPEGSETIL